MVTMAMAMQTMKLLMTQTTLAVSFRHMGSIHQPDLHGVGERRDGEKIEEMGAGRRRGQESGGLCGGEKRWVVRTSNIEGDANVAMSRASTSTG